MNLTMKKLDIDIKALETRIKVLEERLEQTETQRVVPSISEIAKGLRDMGWAPRRA